MSTIDGEEIDTLNKFMVGKVAGKVTIGRAPQGPLSKADAMNLAAWIVALGDNDGMSFDATREAIESL